MVQFVKRIRKILQLTGIALSWLSTRVILTLVFIFLGIYALVLRMLRKDPLNRKFKDRDSYWVPKEKISHTVEQARRQF